MTGFAVTENPIHVLAASSCKHMRICLHVRTRLSVHEYRQHESIEILKNI